MTDIEAKALALVNEVNTERSMSLYCSINRKFKDHEALCRAIEQHEAFKQEVSDIVEACKNGGANEWRNLNRFIIPKPKPDPLEDVLEDICIAPHHAKIIRAALDALGFEIREKGQ
jgi:hypothetical protein